MSTAAPASASEAMEMARAGLGYLAAADATAMAAETQARCLRMLEQAHAVGTAARTSVLAAFTAGQGYSADGDYSPRAWLINRTRITKGAAVGYTGWVRRAAAHPGVIAAMTGSDGTSGTGSDGTSGTGSDGQDAPATDTARAWEALERAIIGKAVDLLSGPGGLASFLRRRQLGARLGGPSLPLDIGYAKTIPAGIRNAVTLRDKHCRWAGGCNQPASACEVHHVRHKKNGGKTSTRECVLLCWFHHQVVIHRQGWTLVLNPDGTTTAWNPDRTKVLHSHSPPVRPG